MLSHPVWQKIESFRMEHGAEGTYLGTQEDMLSMSDEDVEEMVCLGWIIDEESGRWFRRHK
ncbi:hypothetical protein LU298_01990 [Komagataeibacter intermedius]|uniref:Uncharacterized protein n=2 Tax=Komagataeibacter intermedius TaxID=66229 RepID=A0A0N1F814_9PROT|nr:hypothetical protein [Komagataeibacter intermedius]KPH86201.1 hypothetical protein GLUCOINTEAF2_0202900 [Komagataeibacter intermedius AF2]MCF3635279.1 hypothetical protein [Komagataeibacter intermedius]GAN87290.1 hypothetical protein Gain_0057_002 [Komagataeibacter intermedius TF2]GBQ69859.1 hypothetical protein AA0521_1550 [Komagataeibacter intermedius NRIC 0521]